MIPFTFLPLSESLYSRSKNCPNDRPFYVAYYYIISDGNHVPAGISERQDAKL